MDKKQFKDCIDFFNNLEIEEIDVTNDLESSNNQKAVIVNYIFKGKKFTTKKLYYRQIDGLDGIDNKDKLIDFFKEPVYWLDIDKHNWPQGSGESDLEKLVIADMSDKADLDFISFLKTLANNAQTGFIQRITSDGRSAQYYHNLENNNHWHDLVRLIKAAIEAKGAPIDDKFFTRLVFKWNGNKNTERKRASLSANATNQNRSLISSLYKNIGAMKEVFNMDNLVQLLNFKGQIILQGPPGTGKTRKAKEIIKEFARVIGINSIPDDYFFSILIPGIELETQEGYLFDIDSVVGRTFNLRVGDQKTKRPVTIDHLRKIEIEKGNDSYCLALLKLVKEEWFKEKNTRIAQFHPSYSYEDFVRGMVAESNDGQIFYTAKNKEFGEFCNLALKEYLRSKPGNSGLKDIGEKEWVNERIADFAEHIIDLLEAGEAFPISNQVKIVEAGEKGFRYQGNWSNSSLISNEDLLTMYLAKNNSRQDVKHQEGISKSAFYHATYYFNLLQTFRGFLTENNYRYEPIVVESRQPQPFIFVIDEINRANLSSVLGELIYALKYRGEKVKSMYDISGVRDLIIPPNLYIIGTMNTADRSVGHIDYAIRRRFAFVDVLPSIEPIKNESAKEYFKLVSKLFVSNYEDVMPAKATPKRSACLASDFDPEQVWIGHSYFITEKEGGQGDAEIRIKMKYEVLPLIKEYVKDGILNSDEKNADDPVQTVINRLQE